MARTRSFPPFIPPMMAKLTDKLPEGENWTYEVKWDGYRALLLKDHNHNSTSLAERQQPHGQLSDDQRCRSEDEG